MELPCIFWWTDQIISPVNYGGRDVANLVHIVQDPPLVVEPSTMNKEVTGGGDENQELVHKIHT